MKERCVQISTGDRLFAEQINYFDAVVISITAEGLYGYHPQRRLDWLLTDSEQSLIKTREKAQCFIVSAD